MAQQAMNGRRWVRILLVVSLALNIAIVAAVAGFALRGGPRMADGPQTREGGAPYARALASEDRRAFSRSMRLAFREARPDRGTLATDYRAAVAALRAQPYDSAIFEDVLTRQSQRAVERQGVGQQILLEYVAQLSDEQRTAYATRLEVEIARMSERWGRAKRN